jgi:hypothetical protein
MNTFELSQYMNTSSSGPELAIARDELMLVARR